MGGQRRAALQILASHGHVINAVLLPACVVIFAAEWFFFSVADRLHALFRHSVLQQRFLQRLRAAGSQRKVVFFRSTTVTMPFQHHFDGRMLHQERGILLRRARLVVSNLRLVVIE